MGETQGILEQVESQAYDSLADKLDALSKTYNNSDEQKKSELRDMVITDYLSSENKKTYGIYICGALELNEAAPKLMQVLKDSSETKQDLEAAMLALGDIKHAPAYSLIEKYVGSEHNHQALIALSNIDFQRTASYILDEVKHRSRLTMECIFTDALKRYGVKTALKNLTYLKNENPGCKRIILDAFNASLKVLELPAEKISRLIEKAEKALHVL